MTKNRTLAYLAMLGNVLIWGAALPIVKPALNIISPYAFLFYRYLVAGLIMLPFVFLTRPKKLPSKMLFTIILLELIQLPIGLTLLYKGLALTSALEGSLIAGTSPIWVTLGGILFLHEKEERHEWIGLGISILGTATIIIAPLLGTHLTPHASLIGNLYIVAYTLSWMVYSVLVKRYYQNLPKFFVSAVSSVVGLISFALIAPLLSPIPSFSSVIANGSTLLAIGYMGILGSSVAVALFLWGQSKIEASEATLFTYLQPLIYIPLSVLWLGDKIIPLQIVGLLLIITGVYTAEKRTRKSKRTYT